MTDMINEIQTDSTSKNVKKRSILFFQGEVPRTGYIVKSGIVKMYSVNSSGEEQIVSFHTQGDAFPGPWLFGNVSSSIYYYEAHTDCELMPVTKAQLSHAIETKPAVAQQLLSFYAKSHTGLLMRITALEQTRASDKILFTLYYLMFRYGVEVKPGIFQINMGLTHSIIASLIGLTRETTATELNKLRRKKIINYKSLTYFVNKSALEQHLGEDGFSEVSLK